MFEDREQRYISITNGEIYNEKELRAGLRAVGREVKDKCDTAVIPELFARHPERAFDSVAGMFAAAVWDSRNHQLTLVRDRFGIKPLYYALTSEFLIFASEIKAILASGLISPTFDQSSLADLFTFSYPFPPRTMFAGIQEVPPATMLTVDVGSHTARSSRYYSIPRPESPTPLSFSDATQQFRTIWDKVLAEHLEADVPIAGLLSGGIDSAFTVATAQRLRGAPLDTFSVGFDVPAYDESEQIADLARHLGGTNRVLRLTASSGDAYREALWHTETPLLFPVAIAQKLLAQNVSNHGYKVVIGGEGADEIFGGYDCFRQQSLRNFLHGPLLGRLRPALLKHLIYRWMPLPKGTTDHIMNNERQNRAITARFGFRPAWYDVWSATHRDSAALFVAPPLSLSTTPFEPPSEFRELCADEGVTSSTLDQSLRFECRTRLPNYILSMTDRSFMAHGVEARVPFLDHRLVDFAFHLPDSFKIRMLKEKAILRRAAREVLPPADAQRGKRPFFYPLREYFGADSSPAWIHDYLTESMLRRAGVFNPQEVAALQNRRKSLPIDSMAAAQVDLRLFLVLGVQVLWDLFCRD